MGVNTRGFIYGKNKERYSNEKLVEYLINRYTEVKVHKDAVGSNWKYMVITFMDGEDIRNLYVHYHYTSFKNEGYPEIDTDSICLFDLNHWGNSVEIIKGIVAYFGGGYIVENDCSNDWYIVSSDNSQIPEITLHNKLMVEYQLSEKEATEWLEIYNKVKVVE